MRPPVEPVGDPRLLDDDELARRLYPLAVWVASQRRTRRPTDELVAACWWTLFRKAREWDPAGGANPVTHMLASARWEWQDVAEEGVVFGRKTDLRAAGAALPRRVPLAHGRPGDGESGGVQPAARAAAPAVDADEVALMRRATDPRAWEAFSLHVLGGWTLDEVGAHMGVTRERARQLGDRAVRQIVEAQVRRQVAAGRKRKDR